MNINFLYEFLSSLGYTHPLHPTLTHLTIGLVMGALIFRLIATLPGNEKYAQTARHCSTLALLALIPTVILGLMDWSHFYGASWLFPFQMKILLAGFLALLLLLHIFLSFRFSLRSIVLLPVYLLCFFTVVGLGYFGGEIIYGERVVRERPETAAPQESGRIPYADVQEIFQRNCTNCHAGANPPKGLNLTTYRNIMEGSQNGPVVIAGNPGESELIRRVKGTASPRMPLAGAALSKQQIQTLEKWIRAGAPGPGN